MGDEQCQWSEEPTEKQPGADGLLWEQIMLVDRPLHIFYNI